MEHAYVFWRAVAIGSITAFLLTLAMCLTAHGAESLPNALTPRAGEICRPAHCFIPKPKAQAPVAPKRGPVLCYRFEVLVIVLQAPTLVWDIDAPRAPEFDVPGEEPTLLVDTPSAPVPTSFDMPPVTPTTSIWIPDSPRGYPTARTPVPMPAPEIDPNSAGSAITLLAGLLAIITRRK